MSVGARDTADRRSLTGRLVEGGGQMHIRLMGTFAVQADDGTTLDCGGAKQRAVLAQLALEAKTPVSVDRLAEGIWGEQVPEKYRQIIQVYVSNLRRTLDPERGSGSPSRILRRGGAYELEAGDDEVDVIGLNRAVAQAVAGLNLGRPHTVAAALAPSQEIWTSTPLADLTELPFVTDWTDSLDGLRLTATELLAQARLDLGEHQLVADELRGLVHRYPGRERLWEILALAQVRSGLQQEALDTVQQAKRELVAEFGLDPGPALQDLEERILRQDWTVLGVTPPRVAADSVPCPLSPILGRGELLSDIVGALSSGVRLVVLSGPGGVGKTRLALEALNQDDPAVRGAVWVPFADEPPGSTVREVIARRLAVTESALDLTLTSVDLLALDNLEHITDAHRAVAELLSRHRHLRILATSRGSLGVGGERVWAVGPLADGPAISLFTDRARSAMPTFTGDRDDIVELCRCLDSLPLAIELAAARVVTLDPRELLRRMPEITELRSDTALSGRQSSVEASVAWSVDLLSEHQREALTALAALAGAPDPDEVVAAVSALSDRPSDQHLQAIEALARLGLVQPLETRSGRRFNLLQTVRAAVTPEPDEVRHANLAVADYWANLDKGLSPVSGWTPVRLAALDDDLAILRGVVRVLVENDGGEQAARLLSVRRQGLAWVGRQDLLAELCDGILRGGVTNPWERRIEVVAGSATYKLNDLARTATLLKSIDELDPLDQTHRVVGYAYRSALKAECDDLDGAAADAEAAIHAAGEDEDLLQIAHSAAAWTARRRHELPAAADHAKASLALARDDLQVVLASRDLANAELLAGHPERAMRILNDCLPRSVALGDAVEAEVGITLGIAHLLSGAPRDALRAFESALNKIYGLSDPGFTLELVTAIGLAGRSLGAQESLELIRDATAATRALDLGDDSVPAELRPLVAPVMVEVGVIPRTSLSIDILVQRAVNVANQLVTDHR